MRGFLGYAGTAVVVVLVLSLTVAGQLLPFQVVRAIQSADAIEQSFRFDPRTGELVRAPFGVPEGGVPTPGPDVVVGLIESTGQFGRVGPIGEGTVGLALRTTSCNKGDAPLHWFQLPSTDHPLIAMNMYRLQPVDGAERFEQIGQSWVKHAFAVFEGDACQYGCMSSGSNDMLGVGCSDPYSSSLNATQCGLGPRAAFNPYTGAMLLGPAVGGSPCGALNFPSRNHNGHSHNGISHRLQVKDVDLMPEFNVDARYFVEAQYVTPHEFTDAAAFGNQNMHNNVSWQEVSVTGPNMLGQFVFANVTGTIPEEQAVDAWISATKRLVEPAPGEDGRAFVAYDVTNLGTGFWRYEFAVYNMNLDRAIGSFSVPVVAGTTVTNMGFSAPLNHAPEANTPTWSNDPWSIVHENEAVTFSTLPLAFDPNANAIRFGTLYNFRFDADAPPGNADATVGFFKIIGESTVLVAAPSPPCMEDFECDDKVTCNGVEACIGGECISPFTEDCNKNGREDTCDIAEMFSDDINVNSVPDECEQLGDFDGDGDTDLNDYKGFFGCWLDPSGNNCAVFDLNGDGTIGLPDFGVFQRMFEAGTACPVVTGTGLNPGEGDGPLVQIFVSYTSDDGMVAMHPCLPIIGCIEIILSPSGQGQITMACAETFSLGEVSFVDGEGEVTFMGEITFERGEDIACGTQISLRLAQPCNIELDVE